MTFWMTIMYTNIYIQLLPFGVSIVACKQEQLSSLDCFGYTNFPNIHSLVYSYAYSGATPCFLLHCPPISMRSYHHLQNNFSPLPSLGGNIATSSSIPWIDHKDRHSSVVFWLTWSSLLFFSLWFHSTRYQYYHHCSSTILPTI